MKCFKRLNTGGSLLSSQEIRNCSSRMISGGAEFYNELQSLAKLPKFLTATSRVPPQDLEQKADEELVLRFFAVEVYRPKFAGNVREWIDSFMEDILFQTSGIKLDSDHFCQFFTFIADKFEDSAFSRWRDGAAQGRLAPAYFEAVVGALSMRFPELSDRPPAELKAILERAFEDPEFRGATGPGANSKEKLEQRIAVVSRYFFQE